MCQILSISFTKGSIPINRIGEVKCELKVKFDWNEGGKGVRTSVGLICPDGIERWLTYTPWFTVPGGETVTFTPDLSSRVNRDGIGIYEIINSEVYDGTNPLCDGMASGNIQKLNVTKAEEEGKNWWWVIGGGIFLIGLYYLTKKK